MKKALFFCICFIISTFSFSQNYFEQISRIDSLNYFEKLDLIDSLYWGLPDSVKYAKESGYKDFERWRFFMDSRIDSTGHLDSFMASYLDVQKKISGIGSKTGNEIEWCGGGYIADWKPLGFSEKPTDNGQGWRNGLGWMRSIWVDPSNTDIMLAGANMGGLWKTTNGGDSWTSITTNLFDGMGIAAIAVNPLDNDVIYVAPSFNVRDVGAGVWKTINGGNSWFPVFFGNFDITDIAIHPFDTSIVYAIIHNRVFRTQDGGDTRFMNDEAWGIRTAFNPDTEDQVNQGNYGWVDIEFEITGVNTARVHIVGTRFHMISDDNGDTYFGGELPAETEFVYSNINNSGNNYVNDCQIAIRGSVKYRAYVANWENKLIIEKWNASLGIWQFRFSINNFTGGYSGGYHMGGRKKAVFEISSLNTDILYIGGVKFYIYNDATTSLIGPYSDIHDDMRGISVINLSASTELVVVANDGGVKKAIINSISPTSIVWQDISSGLQVQQIHGLSLTNETPATVYTGHQDIGIVEFDGTNKSWSQSPLFAGDGGEVLVDPLDPTKMIWTFGGPPVFTTASSNLDDDFENNILNAGTYNAKFVFTKNRNLYYGSKNTTGSGYKLVKYTDPFSPSYSPANVTVFSFTFPEYFSALYVSPDEQTIYVATQYGSFNYKLFRSLDGGGTWQNHTQFIGSPSGVITSFILLNTFITDIVGNPNNPDELYMSFGYVPSGKPIFARVIKTTNATDTWVSIEDWSDGLDNPNVQGIGSLPVSRLVYDEFSDNHMVYAATDMGVYYRNDDSDGGWIRFSEGLPFALSSDLILDRKEHRLVLATYGRGTWYTDIPCCENTNVATTIETNTTWNTERVISNIIGVPNGVTLTLEDATFWFKPGSQIIVEPGGKLIVDNALLTSYCTSFWGGIVVLGQAGLSSNDVNQGFANITNSTIQYAYRGVFCGDENDFTKSGGIVFTENVTFKDCRVGVAFFPYPSSGGHIATSKIRNSRFLGTEELPDKTGKGMLHGVSLWGIKGVRLEGNDYINSAPEKFNGNNVYWDDNFRGNGVLGIDATFVVDGRTASGVHCQLTPSKNSYFEGLANGVVLLNTTSPSSRNSVISSTFKNCLIGINAIDDVFSKFYKNNFSWDEKFVWDSSPAYGFDYLSNPGGAVVSNIYSVGILHNGSDGFLTEGNTVTYEDNIDRSLNFNAFAFYDVKGSNADYAMRNTVVNNVDPASIPQPHIIGKSMVDDCLNLAVGCNEYCDVPLDWYWVNDNTSKISSQTGNTNNFTDPSSTSNIYNVNYYLKSPGTGTQTVWVSNVGFSVTGSCSYTLPQTYSVTPSINASYLINSPTCNLAPTSNCAAYKTTQVIPGDPFDGTGNPSVDRIAQIPNENEEGKQVIISLINNGKYENAKRKLLLFPENSHEESDFKKLYLLLIEEYEKGKNLHNLSDNGLTKLREIGQNATVSGAKARTILMSFYGEFILQKNMPIATENSSLAKSFITPERNKFQLFPNPAGSYFTLSYEIIENQLPSIIEVTSSLGVVLYSSSLTNPNGTLTLLTNSWADGVYYVNVKDKNNVLFKEKVVLIH